MSIPTNSTITIQGITFNGLKQVKEAVEVIMRIETNLSGKRFFGEEELNRIASYRHIQSLPIDALPALYYCGQGDIVILATED